MNGILEALRADVVVYETGRPRARQVETGASDVNGCRAAAVFRLRGVPRTDVRVNWEAFVGSAVHERLADARAGRGICEQRFTYRGVPATVDYLEPPLLVDYKSRDTVADFPDEPEDKHLGQVHLGAAAAREAGHDITHVALVLIPRAGSFEARVFGPYPFDQARADAAADWAEQVEAFAADADTDLAELRDEPPMFCRRYCPWVTHCRGEPEPDQPLDGTVEAIAAEFCDARDERDRAQARMDDARELLLGVRGRAGHYTISTSRGREWTTDAEDIDELRAHWEMVFGPLPMRTEVKRSAPRLTVKRAAS